eukprot:scaffold207_cov409-Prasinococcus_capsulatus_cf.AAC.132
MQAPEPASEHSHANWVEIKYKSSSDSPSACSASAGSPSLLAVNHASDRDTSTNVGQQHPSCRQHESVSKHAKQLRARRSIAARHYHLISGTYRLDRGAGGRFCQQQLCGIADDLILRCR